MDCSSDEDCTLSSVLWPMQGRTLVLEVWSVSLDER